MSRIDVLRPFIERNLASQLGVAGVQPDANGEYSYPHGSAEITLRLLDSPFPLLQLSAVLVAGVKKRARMLEVLNSINGSELGVRVFRLDDLLVAVWEVPADTLDERQFKDVLLRFADTADRLDTDLARRFGGKTARSDEDDEDEAVDA